MGNNYSRVIEQTDQQKLDMYLKLSKKEIALMLIESSKQLDRCINEIKDKLPYKYSGSCGPL